MTVRLHRRAALARLASVGAVSLLAPSAFATDTTQYFYDSLGRVVRVEFEDGSTVVYSYDAAGNRTQVARTATPPSTTWTQTVAITGTGPKNLFTLATTAGYPANMDADATFTLASGVTISGVGGSEGPGGPGIDTGDWPIRGVYVQLALQISGAVNGGGGGGGNGDAPGSMGGDAIYCRAPMSVTVNSGGIVRGGGGGGGGGNTCCSPTFKFGGGGGGGGAPGGVGGQGAEGLTTGNPGQTATATNGGTGGSPRGGAGGNIGVAGAGTLGGAGGSIGYAIRKNGFTVPVTNNGTIVGTVG